MQRYPSTLGEFWRLHSARRAPIARYATIASALSATLAASLLLTGCAAPMKLTPAEQLARAPHPTALSIFDGTTGARISWADTLDRVAKADAVFVGETHDDAVAHALEHALVDAFIATHTRPAVSLEFLERDEQAKTDAYLRGELALDAFVDETKSRHWAGDETWIAWYQPMIDSARRAKASVVAANAPRTYVSRARTDGYDALKSLSAEERALFEIDESISRDGDWERLKALIVDMRGGGARGATGGGSGETSDADAVVTDDEVDTFHRAQRVWDRTMGLSASRAQNAGFKVIHCVGAFHIGQRLGTVAQFAAACPSASIIVIDLVPSDATVLGSDGAKGADIVVHTQSARDACTP